jgi:hypothetical protein
LNAADAGTEIMNSQRSSLKQMVEEEREESEKCKECAHIREQLSSLVNPTPEARLVIEKEYLKCRREHCEDLPPPCDLISDPSCPTECTECNAPTACDIRWTHTFTSAGFVITFPAQANAFDIVVGSTIYPIPVGTTSLTVSGLTATSCIELSIVTHGTCPATGKTCDDVCSTTLGFCSGSGGGGGGGGCTTPPCPTPTPCGDCSAAEINFHVNTFFVGSVMNITFPAQLTNFILSINGRAYTVLAGQTTLAVRGLSPDCCYTILITTKGRCSISGMECKKRKRFRVNCYCGPDCSFKFTVTNVLPDPNQPWQFVIVQKDRTYNPFRITTYGTAAGVDHRIGVRGEIIVNIACGRRDFYDFYFLYPGDDNARIELEKDWTSGQAFKWLNSGRTVTDLSGTHIGIGNTLGLGVNSLDQTLLNMLEGCPD